jgi:hypothetical protein
MKGRVSIGWGYFVVYFGWDFTFWFVQDLKVKRLPGGDDMSDPGKEG